MTFLPWMTAVVVALSGCSQASRASPAPVTPLAQEAMSAESDQAEAADGACLTLPDDGTPRENVTLEGTLVVDKTFTHPNGTRTRPYVLILDSPPCDEMREVHVAGVEGVELGRWVGDRVRVTGSAMQWVTAWHARPLVLLASSARRPPG